MKLIQKMFSRLLGLVEGLLRALSVNNADGLRDEPLTAIGNAFTYGFGVVNDATWPHHLGLVAEGPAQQAARQ